MKVRRRVEFADLCNECGIRRAVEVGTDRGLFAAEFLARWNGEVLVCVDPWEPYPHMPYDRMPDLMMAVTLLAPFKERVKLMRAKSIDASTHLGPFHSPGFVYIDGDHEQDSVTRDLDAWWPLVVPGGILAGHDYTKEADGVRRAVDGFCAVRGLAVQLTQEADEALSWWVRKDA